MEDSPRPERSRKAAQSKDRVRAAVQPSPLFASYVMVDWSAANAPKSGRDSIWICHLERRDGALAVVAHENPKTRHAAHARLCDILSAARGGVLLGCDFPFAYAAGLAARLGLDGPPWRAIWDEIARLLVDDERNRSNRFAVAAALNRRVSGGAFPFWGCPASEAGPCLARTHHRRHEAEGLVERRLSDLRLRRLQPGWKLAGIGSVGSQALTGIPVIRRLRDETLLAGRATVWPFETGLRPLDAAEIAGRIVFAEVWPSLVAPVYEGGEVKDAAQTRTIARHFARLDEEGRLAALFAGDPALTPAERARVEREEGWVLGVAGHRVGPHPPALRVGAPERKSKGLSRTWARGASPSPAYGRGPE